MKRVTIDVYSNYIVITDPPSEVSRCLSVYIKNNLTVFKPVRNWQTKQTSWEQDKVYAAVDRVMGKWAYRFPVALLSDIIDALVGRGGCTRSDIETITHDLPDTGTYDIKMRDGWRPRKEQRPVLKYLRRHPSTTKFLPLTMGVGKTFISMYHASKLNKRIALVIRPMYIKKWIKDVQELLDITEDQVMVVQGGDNLKALMELADTGDMDDIKVILIGNTTYRNYLNLYQLDPDNIHNEGYIYTPDVVFNKLDIGYLVLDEAHQDFHFNYMMLLYTHLPNVVGLSGTLDSMDTFIRRMHALAFIPKDRYKDKGIVKYMNVRFFKYELNYIGDLTTSVRNRKEYNHIAYEKWLMRSKKRWTNFLRMVDTIYYKEHVERKNPEDKCLIFFGSIDACTNAYEYFSEKYPDKIVRRKVGDDDLHTALEGEIIVSTLKSLGTAIDIEDLTDVILTVNVNSLQALLQSAGRLRNLLKKKKKEVYLHYLWCGQIRKHKYYLKNAIRNLKPMSKSMLDIVYFDKI